MSDILSWQTLLLLAIGYGISRYFVRRYSTSHKVHWTPFESITVTLALFFVSQLVVIGFALLVFSALDISSDRANELLQDSSMATFGMSAAISVVMFGLLWLFLRLRKTAWSAIGLVRPRLRDAGYAAGGYILYLLLVQFVVQPIAARLTTVDFEQRQELGYNLEATGAELLIVFVGLVILPPLIEELVTRGFLFTGLRTRMPFVIAAVLSSVVFGLAHLEGQSMNWAAAINTFTLALVLAYLREKTDSLWSPIGLHAINNGLAFLVLFIFKAV